MGNYISLWQEYEHNLSLWPLDTGLMILRMSLSFASCSRARQSLCAHFLRNECLTFHSFNLACYLLAKLISVCVRLGYFTRFSISHMYNIYTNSVSIRSIKRDFNQNTKIFIKSNVSKNITLSAALKHFSRFIYFIFSRKVVAMLRVDSRMK